MVKNVCEQQLRYDTEIAEKQQQTINILKNEKRKKNNDILNEIKSTINDPKRLRTLEATLENGASNWLTALPIKENAFYLEKQAFWDSLYLRYMIPHKYLPSRCACGKPFTIDHALSCAKGGFINIRHNEIRDFTADLLSECYKMSRSNQN